MSQDQINKKDSKGYTALYYALKKARNSFAEADSLIQAGADINIRIKGKPLLFYFAKPFSMSRLEYLITMGADLGTVDSRGRNLLNMLQANQKVSADEIEEIVYIAGEMGFRLEAIGIAEKDSKTEKTQGEINSLIDELEKSREPKNLDAKSIYRIVKKICTRINKMYMDQTVPIEKLENLVDCAEFPIRSIYILEAFIKYLTPLDQGLDVCRQLVRRYVFSQRVVPAYYGHKHPFWGIAGLHLFDLNMVEDHCNSVQSIEDHKQSIPFSVQSNFRYQNFLLLNYQLKPSLPDHIEANLAITDFLFRRNRSSSIHAFNAAFGDALYECSFHNADYFFNRGAELSAKMGGPCTKGLEYTFYKKNMDNTDFNHLHILFPQKYYEGAPRSKNIIKQIEYLVSKGMDINACDSGNISPLHVAASYKRAGQVDVVRYMLKQGADPCIRTGDIGPNSNKTAADLAKDPAVETLLRSAEAACAGVSDAAVDAG